MGRKLLRFVTGLIVLAVLAAAAPVSQTVAAATTWDVAAPAFNDIAGHDAEGELTLLAALDIFSGDHGLGGPAGPDGLATRAEFVRALVTAMGRDRVAAGLANLRPDFTDEIPTWAWGHVNVAVYADIVSGYADGSFRADAPVTYAEAATMVVRAVSGHAARLLAAPWPYNFIFHAVEHGFAGDLFLGYANLPCTRGDMARLIVSTMMVPRLDAQGLPVADSAVLYDRVEGTGEGARHFGRLVEGTFQALGNEGGTVWFRKSETQVLEAPLAELVHLVGASALTDLYGVPVRAVLDSADQVCFIQTLDDIVSYRGVLARYVDTPGSAKGHDSYEFADGTVIPFAVGATRVQVNGSPLWFEDDEDAYLKADDECAVTINSDGVALMVSATRYELLGYVSEFSPSDDEADAEIRVDGGWIEPVGCGYEFQLAPETWVWLNGDPAGRDDLAEFDVVRVASWWGHAPRLVSSLAPSVPEKTGPAADDAVPPELGALEPLQGPSTLAYAVDAHRRQVEGKILCASTTYATDGITYQTELDLGAGSQWFATSDHGNLNPPLTPVIGTTGRFGLDRDGQLYVRISYIAPCDRVCLELYSLGTAGSFVTLDVRGTPVDFAVAPDAIDVETDVNEIGRVVVDHLTNAVTDFVPFAGDGVAYDIVAVDPVTGAITLREHEGTLVRFVTDPVVYRQTADGNWTYVASADVDLWESDTETEDGYTVKLEAGGEPQLIEYSTRDFVTFPTITVNGPAVSGQMSAATPQNWWRFWAESGTTYTVATWNLSPLGLCDTILALYHPGQPGPFVANDDGNSAACTWASKIVWEADYTGWVHVQVYPYPWSHGGYGTYDLTVTAPTP